MENLSLIRADILEALRTSGILYGLFADCLHHPPDALVYAGDDAPGLHPHRAGQRSSGVYGDQQVRNALLTGTFIIEKLFSIPGLGRYFVTAINDRDYSVTLGLTIFVGGLIIIVNIIVDIMYAVIDPRVKIDK